MRNFFLMVLFFVFSITKLFSQGPGNTLNFDGDNDYVDCGDINDAEAGSGTFEAWFNPNTLSSSYNYIISKSNNGGGMAVRYLGLGGSGALIFSIYLTGNWYTVSVPAGAIDTDKWYHVAVTYDGSEMTLFINSQQSRSWRV